MNTLTRGPLALGLLCSLAAGCAGSLAHAPHGRGAGEWSVQLPSNTSLAQGLAYGRDGVELPEARVSQAEPERLAQQAPARAPRRVPHKRSPAVPPPAAEPARAPEPQPLPAAPASAPEPARSAHIELALARYQEREASSQAQQAFRGGDAVVITAGTVVVVLLIVLLLWLLL